MHQKTKNNRDNKYFIKCEINGKLFQPTIVLKLVVVPRLFIRCLVAYSVFFDTQDVSVLVLM